MLSSLHHPPLSHPLPHPLSPPLSHHPPLAVPAVAFAVASAVASAPARIRCRIRCHTRCHTHCRLLLQLAQAAAPTGVCDFVGTDQIAFAGSSSFPVDAPTKTAYLFKLVAPVTVIGWTLVVPTDVSLAPNATLPYYEGTWTLYGSNVEGTTAPPNVTDVSTRQTGLSLILHRPKEGPLT